MLATETNQVALTSAEKLEKLTQGCQFTLPCFHGRAKYISQNMSYGIEVRKCTNILAEFEGFIEPSYSRGNLLVISRCVLGKSVSVTLDIDLVEIVSE